MIKGKKATVRRIISGSLDEYSIQYSWRILMIHQTCYLVCVIQVATLYQRRCQPEPLVTINISSTNKKVDHVACQML